jgi:hypothetical protein
MAHALLYGADKQKSLNHLRRWITVGTPFIRFRQAIMLYSNLGIRKKAFYIALLLTCLIMLAVLSMISIGIVESGNARLVMPQLIALVIFLSFAPFVAFYVFERTSLTRKAMVHQKKRVSRARDQFAKLHVALFHKEDEAIATLGAMPPRNVTLFHPRFAVASISAFGVFAIPVAFFALASSPAIAQWAAGVYNNTFSDPLPVGLTGGDFLSNLLILGHVIVSLTSLALKLAAGPAVWQMIEAHPYVGGFIAITVLIMVVGCFLFLLSLLAIIILRTLAVGISWLLSKILNNAVSIQLANRILGNDTLGEAGVLASSAPHAPPAWMHLPQALWPAKRSLAFAPS